MRNVHYLVLIGLSLLFALISIGLNFAQKDLQADNILSISILLFLFSSLSLMIRNGHTFHSSLGYRITNAAASLWMIGGLFWMMRWPYAQWIVLVVLLLSGLLYTYAFSQKHIKDHVDVFKFLWVWLALATLYARITHMANARLLLFICLGTLLVLLGVFVQTYKDRILDDSLADYYDELRKNRPK